MANVTLTVTLDAHGVPSRFVFAPDPIDINKAESIYWKQGSSNFAFAAIAFTEDNPFEKVVVSDTQISVYDHHRGKEKHEYSVLIRVGKNYYSSRPGGIGNGGPTIRNK